MILVFGCKCQLDERNAKISWKMSIIATSELTVGRVTCSSGKYKTKPNQREISNKNHKLLTIRFKNFYHCLTVNFDLIHFFRKVLQRNWMVNIFI